MIHYMAFVRTKVSEEYIASNIKVTRIEIPRSPILVILIMEVICSSETLVLIRATWCNIPEDRILHSHCHENLKSYIYPLFYKFIHTLSVIFLSNGCEVLHSGFLQCIWVIKSLSWWEDLKWPEEVKIGWCYVRTMWCMSRTSCLCFSNQAALWDEVWISVPSWRSIILLVNHAGLFCFTALHNFLDFTVTHFCLQILTTTRTSNLE
jgi:hypothetical protein